MKFRKIISFLMICCTIFSLVGCINNSKQKLGWVQEGDLHWQKKYYREDGTFPVSQFEEIDGKVYSFDEDGFLNVGSHRLDESGKSDREGTPYLFDEETGELLRNKKLGVTYSDNNGILYAYRYEIDFLKNGKPFAKFFDKNNNQVETPEWVNNLADFIYNYSNDVELNQLTKENNEAWATLNDMPREVIYYSEAVDLALEFMKSSPTTEGFILENNESIKYYNHRTFRINKFITEKDKVSFLIYSYFTQENLTDDIQKTVNERNTEICNKFISEN